MTPSLSPFTMNQWSLLISRRFLPQFLTEFISACSSNIFKNAVIIIIVYRLTDPLNLNTQFMVALASGIFILPFLLFSITAGQIADKYVKSELIFRIKCAELLIMIAAALGFYWQNIPFLMTVLFFLGTIDAFFGPLKYAILPELIDETNLLSGNALTSAGTFIAILIGTLLGTTLILKAHGQIILSGMLILLGGLGCVSAWLNPKTKHSNCLQEVNFKIFQEIRALYCFTRKHDSLLLIIYGIAWFWLYGLTLLTIFPNLAKIVLHGDESLVALFLAIFTIGIALGSLLYKKLGATKIKAPIIYLSLLGLTIFTLDLGCSTWRAKEQVELISWYSYSSHLSNYHMLVDAFCVAFFGGLYTVPLWTLLQTKTPLSHRSRVIAFTNIVSFMFMIMSSLALIVLAMIGCSIAQNLWFLSIGCACVTLVFFWKRKIFIT